MQEMKSREGENAREHARERARLGDKEETMESERTGVRDSTRESKNARIDLALLLLVWEQESEKARSADGEH